MQPIKENPAVRIFGDEQELFIQYNEGVLAWDVHSHGDFSKQVQYGSMMTSRADAVEEVEGYKDFFRAVESNCVYRLDGSIVIDIVGEKYHVTGYYKPHSVARRERWLSDLEIKGNWIA